MELTDEQLRVAIMEFLLKKGRWGGHYYPTDTIVNWVGKKIRRNGKRVREAIKHLVKSDYLLVHKKGETVSLNPARSKQILELLSSTPL